MIHQLKYGSAVIEYQVRYSNRKTLGITVTPDRKVFVTVPNRADEIRIHQIVSKKGAWISEQLNYFLAFYPRQKTKKYISGESHLFLGRQYTLRVTIGKTEGVRLDSRNLLVTTRTKQRAKRIIQQWYAEEARKRLTVNAHSMSKKIDYFSQKPSAIIIRFMTKRWGSCTSGGKIILNSELIKAPKGCIDYVIAHELCHLVHRNHTQKFFELQATIFPQWMKWKNRLESLLA